MVKLRHETDHRTIAVSLVMVGAHMRHFLAGFVVVDKKVVVGAGLPVRLHGNSFGAPWCQIIVQTARLPLVETARSLVINAAPMAVDRVAGTGEKDPVGSAAAGAQETGKCLMHNSAAFSIA